MARAASSSDRASPVVLPADQQESPRPVPTVSESLARQGLPAGRHLRRLRHQLRAVQRGRRAGRAVPVRRRRRRDPDRRCPRWTASSGTASCPTSSPASATATACTARTTPPPGQRCNPNKLLLDPYAKAIDGKFDWHQSLFAYDFGDPDSRNDDDSAPSMPKSVVINPFFDWGVDRPPGHAVRRHRHLRGARQGPDRDPPRTSPNRSAARTPRSPTR